MQASPAKLPDETWGVRVYDPAHADKWTGQPVTVNSKGGKSWTSVLTEMVSFDGKSVALYRKAEKNGSAPAPAAPAPTNLFETREPVAPIAGAAPESDPAITDAMIAKHAPVASTNGKLSDETLAKLVARAAKIVEASGSGLTANATDATRAVILSTLIAQEA